MTEPHGAPGSIQIRYRITGFRRVLAKDLVPNAKNPRIHTKGQSYALKFLLAKIGYADALLVRPLPGDKFGLLDGHLRAQVTPDMEVPVLITDLDEAEADLVLATLDPLALMAEIDAEKYGALIENLQADNQMLEQLFKHAAGDRLWELLHPEEVQEVEIAPDRAAELAAKWQTATGQIWRVGAHLVGCGDSNDSAFAARLWTPGSPRIRVLWTDPPYGVS